MSLTQKEKTCNLFFSFYLDKVVGEEAPLSVQLPLHPALLLNVPHVPDDVAGAQRQLVVVERVVLVLHQDLWSETKGGGGRARGLREGGKMETRKRH